MDVQPAAQSAPAAPGGGSSQRGPRLRGAEVVQFATQLSVMSEAGVPLGQALRNLAEQTDAGGAAAVLNAVAAAVEAGEPFSAALARFPRSFDPTFVNLVRAGEASGTLPHMLDRTAARLENDLQTPPQGARGDDLPGGDAVVMPGEQRCS